MHDTGRVPPSTAVLRITGQPAVSPEQLAQPTVEPDESPGLD
ncbi:hypothetical protein ACXC9Q_25740 (plasmid) [Kribbella sp. CWNU-51]